MAEASNKSSRKEKKKRKKSQSQVKSEEQTPTVLQHTRSTCAAGGTKQARGNGGCARQQVLHSTAKVTVEEKKDRNNLFFSLGIPSSRGFPFVRFLGCSWLLLG